MTTPITYAQASTALPQPQIRDTVLLPALADAGSTVGGAPTSSPDRGIVEATATFMAMEQGIRRNIALTISAQAAIAAGDDWVDVCATRFQVPSNQGPLTLANGVVLPIGAPGGVGRFVATYAVWTVALTASSAALPLTLAPGQIVQLQATDPSNSIFSLILVAPVTITAGNYPTATFIARVSGVGPGNVAASQLKSAKVITGPAGLSVYQGAMPVLTVSPQDPESSAALVVRCYGRWGTLGAGWTEQAFDYLIPSSDPRITGWSVNRWSPFGAGSVGVWLRTATGTATGPTAADGTDCNIVYTALTAPGVWRLGSGPLVVQPATPVALSITATTATDGSNPNLVANQTAALNAFASAIMGPAIIRAELLEALLMGGAFPNPVEIGQGPSGPVDMVQLNAPGFTGAASFTVLTFSPALYPGYFQLTAGQILALTLNLDTLVI